MSESLHDKLGYRFTNANLLRFALTHPSARHELNLADDNQRLEYLGDAALGLAAADYLFHHYPNLPEGQLTILRSNLTSTGTLAALARSIDLGGALTLGRGEEQSGGREKSNNLADALEAVIGALYLDGGMSPVADLFLHLFAPKLNDELSGSASMNYKGALQEWAQKEGLPCPHYHVVRDEGPAHQRHFVIEVRLSDERKAIGEGSTKRVAEQAAAMILLNQLQIKQI
jgi:ribonuclease III